MSVRCNRFFSTAFHKYEVGNFEKDKETVIKIITKKESTSFCSRCSLSVFTECLASLGKRKSPAVFTWTAQMIPAQLPLGSSSVVNAIKKYISENSHIPFFKEQAVKISHALSLILAGSKRMQVAGNADLVRAQDGLKEIRANLHVGIMSYIKEISFDDAVLFSMIESSDIAFIGTDRLESDIEKYITSGRVNFPLLAEYVAFLKKERLIQLLPKFANYVFFEFSIQGNRELLIEGDNKRAQLSERLILPALLASFYYAGYETSHFIAERKFLKTMSKIASISRESLVDILAVFCYEAGEYPFLNSLYSKLLPKMNAYLDQLTKREIDSFLDSTAKIWNPKVSLDSSNQLKLVPILERLVTFQNLEIETQQKIQALIIKFS